MNELLNFCLDQPPVDLAQTLSAEMVVASSLPSTSQREAAGAMRIDPSRVEFRKPIIGGGECRALASLLCSAEKPPISLSFETFKGSRPKSIFPRERRFSRKASEQIAFLASRRALYVFTKCCQTAGVRFWHLHYPAIFLECRSLLAITFRPTQLARLTCVSIHATT